MSEISDSQGFEDIGIAQGDGFREFGETLECAFRPLAKSSACVEFLPHLLLQPVVARRGGDAHQVIVQATHGLVDGDAVVVEDDDDVGFGEPHIVEGFESLTACERAVADDGDMFAGEVTLHLRRHGHAEGRRNRGGTMTGTEGVVGAFAHLGEAADAAVGAYGLEGFAPTGQNLMGVRLVSYIPDELVVGRVEDIVQGHGEFDGAEARCQVAGMGGECVNNIGAQLIGDALQFAGVEFLEVGRTIDIAQGHLSLFLL